MEKKKKKRKRNKVLEGDKEKMKEWMKEDNEEQI